MATLLLLFLLPILKSAVAIASAASSSHRHGPTASAPAILSRPSPSAAEHLCVLDSERSALYLTMPENMPKGSILATLPVAGVSSGQKANIRLSLVQGRDFVRLNPLSKQLVLRKAIDREQGVTRIEATVQCSPLPTEDVLLDNYFPLNISVFVAVTDVNDNPPKFPKGGQFSVNLPEELPPGTPIRLEFAATDRDQPGPNGQIRYRIVQPQQQQSADAAEGEEDFSSLLAIPDPLRPELFVAGRIDFERLPHFSVFIEAEDQGSPALRSVARLEVNVLDVDDLNPVFSAPIYTASEVLGSQLVIEPGPVRAWDADRTFNETIVFTLSGEHSLQYAIDELTGIVRLLADHLVPAKLVIVASQMNRPERNASALLLIGSGQEATDAAGIHILLKMPSNLALGTRLLSLDSLMNGTAQNETRKLELVGHENHFLFVDRITKSLALGRKLSPGEYEVEVLVKPTPHSRSNSIQKVHLLLVVFEPAEWAQLLPKFEQPKYEFELDWDLLANSDVDGKETLPEFIPIGQIRAIEWKAEKTEVPQGKEVSRSEGSEEKSGSSEKELADESGQQQSNNQQQQQQGLTFILLNGEEHFDIGPESGILRLRNPLVASQLAAAAIGDPNSTAQDRPSTEKIQQSQWPSAITKLLVMAEDAEGRRNFVECTVRLKHGMRDGQSGEGEGAEKSSDQQLLVGWSSSHLLAALCFLLLCSNCATISLWMGKRQFANLYDNLSYDSVEAKGRYGFAAAAAANGKSGKENWMMNRSLEMDPTVKITRPLPRELFSVCNYRPNEKLTTPTSLGTFSSAGNCGGVQKDQFQ